LAALQTWRRRRSITRATTYEELAKLAKEVTGQSPDVINKMKGLLAK
jgi:hypothetical protein